MSKCLLGMGIFSMLAAGLSAQPLPPPVAGVRLRMDWDKFAERASERTEVTLDGVMLHSVARFLSDDDGHDRDEQHLKKVLSGLTGVYIHSYTFFHEHDYPDAAVNDLRRQLKSANWGRIVQSTDHDSGERDEIYMKNIKRDGDPSGLVVLVAEPREFTLVEIAGTVNPSDLGDLNGVLHFRHRHSDDDDN